MEFDGNSLLMTSEHDILKKALRVYVFRMHYQSAGALQPILVSLQVCLSKSLAAVSCSYDRCKDYDTCKWNTGRLRGRHMHAWAAVHSTRGITPAKDFLLARVQAPETCTPPWPAVGSAAQHCSRAPRADLSLFPPRGPIFPSAEFCSSGGDFSQETPHEYPNLDFRIQKSPFEISKFDSISKFQGNPS